MLLIRLTPAEGQVGLFFRKYLITFRRLLLKQGATPYYLHVATYGLVMDVGAAGGVKLTIYAPYPAFDPVYRRASV